MPLYKGTFNWQGEVHTLHTLARCPSKEAAYSIFTRVLAKKLQRTSAAIRRYFSDNGKDNFEIREVQDGRKE